MIFFVLQGFKYSTHHARIGVFYEFNFSFPTSVPGFIRESTIFPKKSNEEEFSHMILLHDIHVILMYRRRLMSYLDTLKWMLPTDVGHRMASVK